MDIQGIFLQEKKLLDNSTDRLSPVMSHVLEVLDYSFSLIIGGDASVDVFLGSYHMALKHYLLSTMSFARYHMIQGSVTQRYAVEASVLAVYLLHHKDYEELFKVKEDGTLDTKFVQNKQRKLVYSWISENYPSYSEKFKDIKDRINSFMAHGDLGGVPLNFDFDRTTFSFFDEISDGEIMNYIWGNANTVIGLLQLVFKINNQVERVSFLRGYEEEFVRLSRENERIKDLLQ